MSSPEYLAAVKELLYKMADDDLIIGHRNSEWIGIGPVLEEDIAFGSLAQDKVGHAYNLYKLLEELGEGHPDHTAFLREEKAYKCCHLVEHPIEDYAFSLVRHFLFDHADFLRFEMLGNSSYTPLANVAKKYRSEIKYHIFHADTWIKQLGGATEESRARMQSALNEAYPLALSIFEPGPNEDMLKKEGVFEGEAELQRRWLALVSPILEQARLTIPEVTDPTIEYGGRQGFHTEFFAPMLEEMGEVLRAEPDAEW